MLTESIQDHWDRLYASKAATAVSWYEAHPAKSLELIGAAGVAPGEAIIDVGAGASLLVDELLAAGYGDLTVLDISAAALQQLRRRLGPRLSAVTLMQQDVLMFQPPKSYRLWHDRAVFHFLVEQPDRDRYVEVLRAALPRRGQVIISAFGPAGPAQCSGLPIVRYEAGALAAQLGTGFALLDSSLATHRTPAGAQQQFIYCRFERRAS